MKKEKTNNKKKRKGTAPLIIMLILLLIFGGAWAVFSNYYNLSNYVVDKDIKGRVNSYYDDEGNGLNAEEEQQMLIEAEKASGEFDVLRDKNVYNILLIGVDRRNKSWTGNSDTMIVMSINYKTKKMHMISFMRDMYADIDGYGVRKLNAACAVGGGPKLVETIEKNYKIGINNYASVDFEGMAKIVDYVGGVELTLSEAEVRSANDMVRTMCQEQNEPAESHILPGEGTYNCDGFQAVAYARIRSVGNSDWQRTERQRTVLTKIIGKIKALNFTELNSFVRKVLPLVTHNIESTDMLKLVSKVPVVLTSYELGKSRVPYDGLYTIQSEILYPDMKATIQRLQSTILGTEIADWEEK